MADPKPGILDYFLIYIHLSYKKSVEKGILSIIKKGQKK